MLHARTKEDWSSSSRPQRAGISLLETLVVFLIIGIFFSLLLSAIMRIRQAAFIAESKNNLRQIVLGLHNYAASNQGKLPLIPFNQIVDDMVFPMVQTPSLFVIILPFLEQMSVYENYIQSKTPFPSIPLYISPADPSMADANAIEAGVTSYAANAEVFHLYARLPDSFADGTSNTILFGEHYAYNCGGQSFYYWDNMGIPSNAHRPTFADVNDVGPVVSGNPPVTLPSSPYTFQVAPSLRECDPYLPQTPHSSGMLVALGDGSIRTVSGGVSERTFWSAVTPAGGEVLGSDW
jgi:type II secretory pathway pseudopilin PulG